MRTQKALIIVDVQNDFVEGGSLGVNGGKAVSAAIINHLREHHSDYDLVITTQDWHIDPGSHWSDTPNYTDTWPVHCAADTEGSALVKDLAEELASPAYTFQRGEFVKGEFTAAYSGFEGHAKDKGLSHTLQNLLEQENITEVDIVGIATDHCVKATAEDALETGVTVNVLSEMTAGVTPETSLSALTTLKRQGARIR